MPGIPTHGQNGGEHLEGSWEREGRNPAAAGLIGLFAVGVIYFYGQILILFIVLGVESLMSGVTDHTGARLSQFLQEYTGPIRIALLLSQVCGMLLPTIWLVQRWHTRKAGSYLRFARTTPVEILLAFIGTAALFPVSTFIAERLEGLFPVPTEIREISESIFTAHAPGEFVWLIVVIAVTPAICEEVLFRGYAQRTLERKIGWKSIIVIGIIFGLFHMQPIGLISLSLIGIFIGYLFYRSGSIFPSMVAHFTNNMIALWIVYQKPVFFGVDLAGGGELPGSWLIAAVLLCVVVILLYQRVTRERWNDARIVQTDAEGDAESRSA